MTRILPALVALALCWSLAGAPQTARALAAESDPDCLITVGGLDLQQATEAIPRVDNGGSTSGNWPIPSPPPVGEAPQSVYDPLQDTGFTIPVYGNPGTPGSGEMPEEHTQGTASGNPVAGVEIDQADRDDAVEPDQGAMEVDGPATGHA